LKKKVGQGEKEWKKWTVDEFSNLDADSK